MILFLAGLPGAGKSSLSKVVSEALDIPRFEIDEIKRELYPSLDPDFMHKLDNNIPLSEEVHIKVYEEAARRLKALAAAQEHFIVDEMLYKKSLRDMLFDTARTHFGGYMTVWVKTPDAAIKERLTRIREGHLLKDPIGTYEIFKQKFEDIEDADIVFENEGTFEESASKLVALVREKWTISRS